MFKNPKYVYSDDVVIPSKINFGEFALRTLWEHRDKIAIINGITDERLTYRTIVQQAVNLAVSLKHLGVRKGDVIAICSENTIEFWSTVMGISFVGAVITTVNVGYLKDELNHVLSISKPRFMFCSPFAFEKLGAVFKSLPYLEKIILFGNESPRDTLSYNNLVTNHVSVEDFEVMDVQGQTDTLFVLYSSGTTGLPKGVMLTHLNLLTNSCIPNTLNSDELVFLVSPWYHVMGLMGMVNNFMSGATVVHIPKFEADKYLKTVEKYKIPQLVLPPTAIIAVCKAQAQYDVSSVKFIFSGSAPLREDTIQMVKRRFCNVQAVLQGYGMTETTLGVLRDTYMQAHLAKVGGCGLLVPSTTAKVVDIETRRPLGANELGELCFKGSLIMKGYIGKDNKDYFDEEGFLKTGDIGYYDEDQYFFVVDRLKELIKYKGYQVPPAEIEAVLMQHPMVKEVGVVGIPHDVTGEIPRAFVVKQPGGDVSEAELVKLVADKLSNPKQIRGGVSFVQEIPKTQSGKILRNKLKEIAKNQSKL